MIELPPLFVSYVGQGDELGQVQYGWLTIDYDAPVSHRDDLKHLADALDKHVGRPVSIISWQRLERP